MNWIEDATEVLAEGTTPEGKRMQIVAEPVECSSDLMPEDDGCVPTMYMGHSGGSFSLTAVLNPTYFPADENSVMNAITEIRSQFRDNWIKISERWLDRWLRIMGAKDARVRVVELNQSNWGIMVSAYGQDWQDVTGVADDYRITDEDTEEFENWLKGEVSWITSRVASHDCNCDYCGIDWHFADGVDGWIVYAAPGDIQHGISDKYAYVVDEMIAESGMIQ